MPGCPSLKAERLRTTTCSITCSPCRAVSRAGEQAISTSAPRRPAATAGSRSRTTRAARRRFMGGRHPGRLARGRTPRGSAASRVPGSRARAPPCRRRGPRAAALAPASDKRKWGSPPGEPSLDHSRPQSPLHDGRGEIPPGDHAAIAIMVDAVALAARFDQANDVGGQQLGGVGRRAELVVDHAHLLLLTEGLAAWCKRNSGRRRRRARRCGKENKRP